MRLLACVSLLLAGAAIAAPARLPVKELTVFKDGHAFVLREGKMPVDESGDVLLDDLPTPVLGTFWTWSNEPKARLNSVTAGQRRVSTPRTALSVRELVEANPGADVEIVESGGAKYAARILGVPTREPDEAPGAPRLPEKGSVVLLKTDAGEMAVPLDRIQSVTFKGDHQPAVSAEELRNRLTLRMDWSGAPAREAGVGMVYVQLGLRWIPGYKVEVDGKGNATVKFQATLVNELTDLDDVTANLVVGVPSFAMAGTNDPMALQQTVAQLGQYFDRGSRFDNFSNAIATQAAGGFGGMGYAAGAVSRLEVPGPEVTDADRKEDFFIFTVRHITLRKGERMVLPVAEYALKYKDVYTVSIPFVPPQEVRSDYGSLNRDQLARMKAAPKAQHILRITNGKEHPFTTAPALITSGGRVLGQGLMTYTPAGEDVDLPVTTAVDVSVRKADKEITRVPNAATWNGEQYGRVDLSGVLSLANRKDRPVNVEVTRYVLGATVTVDSNGTAEMVNVLEDQDAIPAGSAWWMSYNWPYWWHHFNGVGKFTWKVTLAPAGKKDLTYTWHYFWR